MDLEALRRAAASRRAGNANDVTLNYDEAGVSQKVAPVWKCEYCSRTYKFEKVFMKHVCDKKRKIDEIRSPVGQSAYQYYAGWMRENGRSVPPIETFIHSSMYNTFIRFAKHIHHVNMPAPENFIRLMVAQNVAPTLWCRDNVYAMYMKSFDKAMPPEEQFMQSVEFLLEYSSRREVDVRDAFADMGVEKFLGHVQKRKLSPWFLAASSVFKTWVKTLEAIDSAHVEASVQVGALMISVSSDPKKMTMFTEFCRTCREFNL